MVRSTKAKPRAPRRKPGEDQARAWIAHVIPRLIEGLERELHWLEQKTASWRCHDRSLEYFMPLRNRVYVGLHPLVDQFLRYYPHVAEGARAHDAAIATLHAAAARAHDVLVGDRDFVHAVEAAHRDFTATAALKSIDSRWQGAAPDDKRPDLAAQYIVNSVGPDEVPYGYSTRDFWSLEGEQLLRQRARFREAFQELDRAVANAAHESRSLRDELARERDELADRFGIAAATIDF